MSLLCTCWLHRLSVYLLVLLAHSFRHWKRELVEKSREEGRHTQPPVTLVFQFVVLISIYYCLFAIAYFLFVFLSFGHIGFRTELSIFLSHSLGLFLPFRLEVCTPGRPPLLSISCPVDHGSDRLLWDLVRPGPERLMRWTHTNIVPFWYIF